MYQFYYWNDSIKTKQKIKEGKNFYQVKQDGLNYCLFGDRWEIRWLDREDDIVESGIKG